MLHDVFWWEAGIVAEELGGCFGEPGQGWMVPIHVAGVCLFGGGLGRQGRVGFIVNGHFW